MIAVGWCKRVERGPLASSTCSVLRGYVMLSARRGEGDNAAICGGHHDKTTNKVPLLASLTTP